MNVEIGAEVPLFPEKKYISGIFVAVWSGSMEKEIVLKYTDLSTNIATYFPNNYSHPSPSNLATHLPPTLPPISLTTIHTRLPLT